MIAVRNTETGETQIVASASGYDAPLWEVLAIEVPADLGPLGLDVVGDALVTPPRTLPLFTFLDLWTPAETIAVMQTESQMLAYAWARTLASPVINLGDSRVIAGVQIAVMAGVLTQARADAILAGEPF